MAIPRPGRERSRPGKEFDWIRWIRRLESKQPSSRLLLGIGDDAAIWKTKAAEGIVLTVDVLVEGVHFRKTWLSPREIGLRAVTASVSDLAAMAARPRCLLVSITAPEETSQESFRQLYRGIREAARKYDALIAGGNLSVGPLSVTIAAVGEGKPRHLVRRSGARVGDSIWVTGSPGLAHLGLQHLLRHRPAGRCMPLQDTPPAVRRAVRAFRRPWARVREAQEIVHRCRVTAMVDLSDGLAADLGHVLGESAAAHGKPLGAVLKESAILGLPGLRRASSCLRIPPLAACLRGGDDYELAFTVSSSGPALDRLLAYRQQTRVSLRPIGTVTSNRGLWIETADGSLRKAPEGGWSHF